MAFLVNEPVTQSDLNNIAVDLGDAEFSAFNSNKFGVDKLNAITADLVTSGVLRTLDMCKPTLTNGNVNIAKGVIVFSDGAKLRITSPVNITAVANAYVAARYDSTNGTCSLVSVAEIPTETGVEYMKLAQVNADCTAVTDLRTMAAVKTLSAATENNIFCVNLNDEKIVTTNIPDNLGYNNWQKEIIFEKFPTLPEGFKPQRVIAPYYNNGATYYFLELPETCGEFVPANSYAEISAGDHVMFARTGTGIKIIRSDHSPFSSVGANIYLI